MDYATKKPCSVESCDRSAVARSFCAKHYQRWKNHGDPNVVLDYTGPRPGARSHGEASEGRTTTPEYVAWKSMIGRCYVKSNGSYHLYGARGITVCKEWRESYPAFLAHVGRRPSPQHSLDRYPNKHGNYEPGNVRWATITEQQRNTKRNRYLTIDGETKCVSEWALSSPVGERAIHNRLEGGMVPKDAVFKPRHPHWKPAKRNLREGRD